MTFAESLQDELDEIGVAIESARSASELRAVETRMRALDARADVALQVFAEMRSPRPERAYSAAGVAVSGG